MTAARALKADPNLLRILSSFRHTRHVPPVREEMLIDEGDVVWTHRSPWMSQADVAAWDPLKFDNSEAQRGLARRFIFLTAQTVVEIGGVQRDSLPPVDSFIAGDHDVTLVELAGLIPHASLSEEDQRAYAGVAALLLRSIFLLGKRHAALLKDDLWREMPVKRKAFCPLFTDHGFAKNFSKAPYPMPTPETKEGLVANNPKFNMMFVARSPMVNGAIERMTRAWAAGDCESAFKDAMMPLHAVLLRDLRVHVANDRKLGRVTPLTLQERDQAYALQDAQSHYEATTIEQGEQIPAKPAPTGSKPWSPMAHAIAWFIGGVFAVKMILDTLRDPPPLPSLEPHTAPATPKPAPSEPTSFPSTEQEKSSHGQV